MAVLDTVKFPWGGPIVFLHIPKTAGTNLTFVLEANYAALGAPKGFAYWKDGERFCQFGHGAFPHSFADGALAFVMLRDPVKRVYSHFYEAQRNGDVHPRLTLERVFLQEPHLFLPEQGLPSAGVIKNAGYGNVLWTSNYSVQYLMGSLPGRGPVPVTEAEFIKVRDALLNDQIINSAGKAAPVLLGATERMNESLEVFGAAFGWKSLSYRERSPARRRGATAFKGSARLEEAIRKANPYDIALHEIAKKRLDEHVVRLAPLIAAGKKRWAKAPPPPSGPPGTGGRRRGRIKRTKWK